jgi:hypothetical protein
MNTSIAAPQRFQRNTGVAAGILMGLLVLAVRAVAGVVFVVMAMAEPFLAVILGACAFGCFFVSVLFGFILRMPFGHRWEVLGIGVGFVLTYVVYRFVMLGVQRVMR